jgi:hypothetical protein
MLIGEEDKEKHRGEDRKTSASLEQKNGLRSTQNLMKEEEDYTRLTYFHRLRHQLATSLPMYCVCSDRMHPTRETVPKIPPKTSLSN